MQQPSVAGSAATGCANRDLDFVSQAVRNLFERASQPEVRRRARRMHSDPPQRTRDYQVRQKITTPRYRVDDLEALVLRFSLSFELCRDILSETKGARGGVDDDGKSSSIAPAPQRISNGLRHVLVPPPIAFRSPRCRAAQAGNIRRNPQRLVSASGQRHKAFRKGGSGRLGGIATEHAVDACAEIDCRGTVPVSLGQAGSGTWHWPGYRGHKVRADNTSHGSRKCRERLHSKHGGKRMRSPQAHARQRLDRFPVLRESQRYPLRRRAVLECSELFDQRSGVDSDRTGNGAHAVARAGFDPVVLILML